MDGAIQKNFWSRMKKIKYNDVVHFENKVINNEFVGFKEDYLVIYHLLSLWKPKKIFEIGTNTGMGCAVMHDASPESEITTLDVRECGPLCPMVVKKVVGDSMIYDFTPHHPIDCWFIDGNHTYENVYKETMEAIKSESKYVIYHDADLKIIYDGIMDSFRDNTEDEYDLYQVIEPPFIYSSTKKNVTRISYAIRKT